jgi:hypothetical protein
VEFEVLLSDFRMAALRHAFTAAMRPLLAVAASPGGQLSTRSGDLTEAARDQKKGRVMIIGIKPEVWFPVGTLILGALAKGIGDWLLESRKATTDREARREARDDNVRAKALEFQRVNLLKLQGAAQALAKATGKSQHEDLIAFRKSGVWGKNQYSEETSQGSLDGHIRMTRFGVRVADDEIRSIAEQFGAACSRHVLCKSESDGDACMSEAMDLFRRLNERIGVALRSMPT